MPTGTPLAVLSRTSRKPGPKRSRSASMRRPYIGSTSSAASDRNRSSAGKRAASAIDSSRKCPDPVMHQAKRERAGGRSGSAGVRDFDAELVEFAVEGVAADIECLGHVAHVPAVLLEQLQQNPAFVDLDRVELEG